MTKIKMVYVVVMVLFLSGCDSFKEPLIDPAIREKVFFQCLAELPQPSNSTHYSDWDEVVEQCGRQAYVMANEWAIWMDKNTKK